MKQTTRLLSRAALIVAMVFAVDRLVKHWCIAVLKPRGTIPFSVSYTHLTLPTTERV